MLTARRAPLLITKICPLPSSNISRTLNFPHSSHKLVYTQNDTLTVLALISPTNCPLDVREHTIASHTTSHSSVTKSPGDQPFKQEECYRLPRLSESEPSDSELNVVLDSLLPYYKEVLSPTPLPTYLGSSLFKFPSTDTSLGPSEISSTNPEKDYTWSRGHGFEHSPIKTRSARHKEGTSSK